MSWNYRVLKTQAEGDVPIWAVHEVYYDKDGNIESWTVNPTHPMGESWNELQRDAGHFTRALMQPALDVTSGKAVELTLTGRPKRKRWNG